MKSGDHTLGRELDEEAFRQQEREAARISPRLKGKPLSDEPMFV